MKCFNFKHRMNNVRVEGEKLSHQNTYRLENILQIMKLTIMFNDAIPEGTTRLGQNE